MAGSVATLKVAINELSDSLARNVSYLWDTWHQQRLEKIKQWSELRNYIFATDTTTTSNSLLPWKN